MEMTSILVVAAPPLFTLDEAKLRAGLDWPPDDPRDDLMMAFVATATHKVEIDTELELLTQTREVVAYGNLPTEIALPAICKPLQSVASITYVDVLGAAQVVDPLIYAIDAIRGRLILLPGEAWPTNYDAFDKWTIQITAGWLDVDSIPPMLVQAAGVLVGHLATLGRDLATADTLMEVPYGYDECVAPFRPVVCA